MTNATRNHNVKIANNDSADIAGPVDFIRLQSSSGELIVDIGGLQTSLVAGNAIRIRGKPIDGFVVRNNSGAEVTATFKLGNFADFEDSNLSGTVALEKATGATDTADQAIANGATVTITPSATARALIIYFDPNNTGNLRTGPAAAAARGRIGQPGIEHVWNTTKAIKVHNDSGAAQNFGYAEETD